MTKPPPLFFIALLATLFLAIFYNTVTNMAGIYIASELGGSTDISVYSMVFFGLGNLFSLPLATPLADRLGAIKLLVYALLLYSGFSILCGLASTLVLFNLFRFGLGMASGPFYILSRRLLIALAPLERLESYSFVMVLMYAVVPVLGASFGAWLAYENFWSWIFHVNEPIALLLALYFWFFYREADSPHKSSPPFDRVGYLFFALGIGTLVTAATLSQQLDWYRSPTLVALTMVGIPSLLFFILWELKHPEPLFELQLLRSPLLAYSLLNLAILFSSYFGMIILITLWLNIYVNYTPLWIAALVGAMACAGFLAWLLGRLLFQRFDPRITLALSILSFASSCYYSTYFDVTVDFFHLAVARSLAGLGLVLFLFPVLRLALASHGPEKSTPIFLLFQSTRVLFSSLGAGLYVILWQRRQVFFHERLGEALTPFSQLTSNYFYSATNRFYLTPDQATGQLDVFLNQQATSLGLNDVFGYMGYMLLGLLVLLVLSFATKRLDCSHSG